MSQRSTDSGSDPGARIFNRALSVCLNQPTRRKSDPILPSNGFRHDSQQKSVLGSNHFASPMRKVVIISDEVTNLSEIYKLEDNVKSSCPDSIEVDVWDNSSSSVKQKENLTIHSPVSQPVTDDVEKHSSENASSSQSKRKLKSVISIIQNHLSGDSTISKQSLKRSAESLSVSFESEYDRTKNRSLSDVFMSERRSDTALLRPEPKETPKSPLHSTPNYISGNLNRNITFKSRSFESRTPNSRFSHKSSDVQHRRSFTFPSNRRSLADVTPYSTSSPSSESSPMRRVKRMRVFSYVPPYDLKGISLKLPIRVIDSHCHLDFLFTREDYHASFSKYRLDNAETFPDCYEGCITIFCEPQNFLRKPLWDSILQERGVWAAFGCHPHMASNYNDETENALVVALGDPKVVALGEIGLDYSRRNNCDRELQKRVLRRQLSIALVHKKPLVIHCREAHDDCIEIIKEMVPREHFIHLHCFTDTWERAEIWLKEFPNLYIGITNLVTFPTAEDVHAIAKKIPFERLLLETDTPYFVPRLLTKRWSHPGMVIHAAAQIAAFRTEISLQNLLSTVRDNTHRMYKI